MRWSAADISSLRDEVAVVTGATSGLGLATTRALAGAGATVVLAARNADKAVDTIARLREELPSARLVHVPLDLASLDAIAAAADELHERFERIGLLVNNAGVMNTPLRRTVDGFELQFGVNHLGHFALTGQVLDLLADADDPRVVTVSSQVARIGRLRHDDPNFESGRYQPWLAYAQSKLANQVFAVELHRRLRAARSPIASLAAHPGYADTELQAAGPRMRGGIAAVLARPVVSLTNRVLAQDAETGALPLLFAATAPIAASGHYYGPDGRFGAQGYPAEVNLVAAARDPEAGRRLWELSEHLTGVTYDFHHGAAGTMGSATA